MLGLGGAHVEAFGEVSFRLPPLGADDIDQMIEQSGVDTLLASQRGRQPADRAALEATLARLSDLVLTTPALDQIEMLLEVAGILTSRRIRAARTIALAAQELSGLGWSSSRKSRETRMTGQAHQLIDLDQYPIDRRIATSVSS